MQGKPLCTAMRYRTISAIRRGSVFAIGLVVVLATVSFATAQTSSASGTTTANFKKAVTCQVTSERVIVSDSVAVNYTIAPSDNGAQVALTFRYQGFGTGQDSGRQYTLTGIDQQSVTAGTDRPVDLQAISGATLTAADTSASQSLRIKYQVTLQLDGGVSVAVTAVEVAQ